MAYFICVTYVIVFAACLLGAFNDTYKGNLLQRIALSIMAFWCVWRVGLVWKNGWGYPHEPVIATALLLFAIGTFSKTRYHWKHRT